MLMPALHWEQKKRLVGTHRNEKFIFPEGLDGDFLEEVASPELPDEKLESNFRHQEQRHGASYTV